MAHLVGRKIAPAVASRRKGAVLSGGERNVDGRSDQRGSWDSSPRHSTAALSDDLERHAAAASVVQCDAGRPAFSDCDIGTADRQCIRGHHFELARDSEATKLIDTLLS